MSDMDHVHRYGCPLGWDNEGGAVQDNPARHDYNLDSVVEHFVSAAIGLANITKLDHQLWACGSDFQYQNAGESAPRRCTAEPRPHTSAAG